MTTPEDLKEEERSLKREFEEGLSAPPEVSSKKRRKKKKDKPLSDVFYKISMAAKTNDRPAAMEAFRSARDAGLKLTQGLVNTVLFVIVGGEDWFETAQTACQPEQQPSPEVRQLEAYRDEVIQYMQEHRLLSDAMVYIAQARLSACLGDPDGAFHLAQQMLQDKITARLRVFTPALVGFAERGEIQKALEIEKIMDEHELEYTELEFRLLLKACTNAQGASYSEVARILWRIGKELTFLEKDTIDVARTYFTSTNSQEAFAQGPLSGRHVWMVEDVHVDENGFCMAAGENLKGVDLEDHDWDAFISAFERLALSKEHKGNSFQNFTKWLEQNGPFSLIVDGANVAFYNQNFDQGAFCFSQVNAMMKMLEKEFPDRKALLVLHINRTRGQAAKKTFAQALLKGLQERNQIVTTPVGSNDDWYWLYAAVRARCDGLLVSNDECRDHIFQLLAPKYFLKWKERHLVRYDFSDRVPSFQLPSIYTACTQQLSNGTWMMPYRDEEDKETWLCARPL